MKRRPGICVAAVLIAFVFCGCLSISTSSGRKSASDAYSPTGKASARAKGLGPEAPRKIWTDGAGEADRGAAVTFRTYTDLAREANPAIVNIFTTQDLRVGIGDPLGIFSLPLNEGGFQAHSLGTGFFVSPDGFLLTNAHVVAKADKIHVYLHDRSEGKDVRVIGVDALTDLALLKVEGDEPFPYLALADSDRVDVGEMVVAIGNPFGLEYSLTTGVISAKNRVLNVGSRRGIYEDFLQTSAQINPGNSGGPLLNLTGEVVGINTAIIARAQGIGFALPSNMIKGLLPNLARNGRMIRGYAGIGLAELNPALAKRLHTSRTKGAVIVNLDKNGPAAKAGLSTGDVILAVNGEAVENSREASRKIAVIEAGHKATLDIARRSKEMTISFTMTKR